MSFKSDAHTSREYDVELQAGHLQDLARLPYQSVQYDRLVRARGSQLTSTHGITLLGGIHGAQLEGEATVPSTALGYSADLPWFSVSARLRLGLNTLGNSASARRHEEYGLSLLIERFTDLPWFSLAFGILAESTLHRQVFTGTRAIKPRQAFGAGFGALLAIERHLTSGLAIRIEAGPLSTVLKTSTVEEGVEQAADFQSSLTWMASLGIKWRL